MFRRCSGYSQKKVARLLGFSDTSSLSLWEHGAALPRMKHAFRLARIYRVLPHELFSELWHQTDEEFALLAQNEEPFTSSQSFYL